MRVRGGREGGGGGNARRTGMKGMERIGKKEEERWKNRGRLARQSLRREGWKQRKDTRRSGRRKDKKKGGEGSGSR